MPRESVPEADWRTFRRLREAALERFCERVLAEIEAIGHDTSRTQHERYLAVFALVRDRDEEMVVTFDALRRSDMIRQLAAMRSLDLLKAAEFSEFSPEIREAVEFLVSANRR